MKETFKILIIILSAVLLLGCGKKSSVKYPGGQKKPNFENVIDEGVE